MTWVQREEIQDRKGKINIKERPPNWIRRKGGRTSNEKITLLNQNSGEFVDQLKPKVKEAYGDKIIQFKSNKISNGLITLENFFDLEDAKNDKRKLTAKNVTTPKCQ